MSIVLKLHIHVHISHFDAFMPNAGTFFFTLVGRIRRVKKKDQRWTVLTQHLP